MQPLIQRFPAHYASLSALGKDSGLRLWLLATVVAVVVFALTRGALLAVSWEVLSGSGAGWPGALLRGALRDLPVAALVALPFLLLETLSKQRWRAGAGMRRLRFVLFALYVFTLLFVAVSEGIFWGEFGVRFNFIALDYLVFTNEVIGNIRESYPVGRIVAALLGATLLIVFLLRRRLAAPAQPLPGDLPRVARSLRRAALLLAVVLPLPLFLKLQPPEFSANAYANELADNGWRSFIWAARQNRLDYRQFYATRPDAEVMRGLAEVAGHSVLPVAAAAPRPAKLSAAGTPARRPNIVVVMMESLSAEFMDTFGSDKHLTPNLDRLAKEGVLFSQLYAAGTRTVRGLEALSAALPPLPGKSIVRWEDAGGLHTLGSSFASHGWAPYFIYGGYGMFDNMNAYFSGNGYTTVDRPDFPEPAAGEERFANIWGVADEHLFDQVIATLDRDHARGAPVFAHVMTTSNHVPFTYPDGRIDIPSPGKREGGVKYSDYAIGHFIEQAKQKPWFDNTIFLFVADHCAFSAGKTRIPVPRYHIPAIVYAPKIISPRVVDTLASQIDLAPTLLALAGFDQAGEGRHFLGRDILTMKPEEGRALLSTYQNLGYLKGDVLTVLSPRRKVEAFRVNREKDEAQPITPDPALTAEAIAWFQGTAMLMEQHVGNHHH